MGATPAKSAMQAQSAKYRSVAQMVALLCAITAPAWGWALFFSWNYDYAAGMVLVPAIVLVNLALLLRVSYREPQLKLILPAALLLKVAAASLYLWMVFHVWTTGSDILTYWSHGEQIANYLVNSGGWVTLQPFWSTNFIIMLTGLLFSVTTPSLPVGVVVYSMVSFWGQYLFLRAFLVAFPKGNKWLAAVLIFLLPSIVFWTATIGKDAVICFCLGLTAYAFARLHQRVSPGGFLLLGLGLAGVTVVRPHVAAMLGIAAVLPYLLGKNRQGVAGLVGKLVGVPLLLAGCVLMATQAQAFLGMEDISQTNQVLQHVGQSNLIGGSAFGASQSLVVRILNTPFLLFRPWPWEIHNLTSVISSLEGIFLLGLFIRNRRSLYAA
ncbi:MAG TPA: hypothetical protein VE825_14970, partial [Terriglobales bacterium]|nr:hypothetical protein [Terriglobales bacterium]